MPKVLPDLKRRLLDAAEVILKDEGYDALTVARVAAGCSVAVGTLYNYFPSKLELAAQVIARDWLRLRTEMEAGVAPIRDFAQGLEVIRSHICAFNRIYAPIWEQFGRLGGSHQMITSRHRMLRDQVTELIHTLCTNTGRPQLARAAPMLAECVLAAVVQPDMDGSTLRDLAEMLK